jgi:hypothetical protein
MAQRQLAEEMNYNCVILNLANQTPEDLLGYPDGKGGYLLPNWLTKEDSRPTIYFLDEINRAPKYVLQCMFNFINEGRIHTHTINDSDVVIAAANPSDMDYEVTEFEDKAFLSRFAHFYLEPSNNEFLNYLEASNAHQAVIDTMRTAVELIDVSTEPKYRVTVSPDRRSIDKIGTMMTLMTPDQVYSIGGVLFPAMIGSDASSIILENFKSLNRVPSIESILATKSAKDFKFKNDDLDIVTVINGNLSKHIHDECYDDSKAAFTMSKAEYKAVKIYLDYIPRDAEIAFISALKNRFEVQGTVVSFFDEIDKDYLTDILELNDNA